MPKDWERIYRELSHLIATMPSFDSYELSPDDHVWLGRANAMIVEVNGELSSEVIRFQSAIDHYPLAALWQSNVATIRGCAFRAFGLAERNAPAGVAGSFIPVGQSLDAFASVAKVLAGARTDLLVVDAYMDASILIEFAVAAPEGVQLRLLADSASVKPSLLPAAKAWEKQYGVKRPLAVRTSQPRELHDRAIFVDGKEVWLLSQSFNAMAARSPATIQRADPNIASEKIPAYEAIWARATTLA